VVNSSPNSSGALVRLAVIPSSPPKNLLKMSEEAAISSAMPSEIIAKTVPERPVENDPNSAANSSPPSAPTTGTSGSGNQNAPWPAWFSAWAAMNPPRPKYTA
jgi:hypothetical protein